MDIGGKWRMSRKTGYYGLAAIFVVVLVVVALLLAPQPAWQTARAELSRFFSDVLPFQLASSFTTGSALPGEEYILFTSNRDSVNPDLDTLYLMKADGRDVVRLTTLPSFEPELAPDGQRVVFAGDDEHGSIEIYVVDLVTRQVDQLTRLGTETRNPTWSPDSRRIIFEGLDPETNEFRLYLIEANGQDRARPLEAPAGSRRAAWSPDGVDVAFIANNEIHTINLDTGQIKQLTDNALQERRPKWSPDGRLILFSTSSPDGQVSAFDLYTVNPETLNQVRLTEMEALEAYPAWSPDGTRLVFMGLSSEDTANIYVMDAAGTNPRQLTDSPARAILPLWSPDGQRIAFTSDFDGDLEIFIMDADGSNVVQLTDNRARDVAWAWLR